MIALYALVLQAVLGGMMPVHAAGLDGVLCSSLSGVSSSSGPDEHAPAGTHKHADCCTAAHAPTASEPPRAVALAVSATTRPMLRIHWDASQQARPRAPPGLIAHPRGPPAA